MIQDKKYDYVVTYFDGEHRIGARVCISLCDMNENNTHRYDSAVGLCTLIAVRKEIAYLVACLILSSTLVFEVVRKSCIRGSTHNKRKT